MLRSKDSQGNCKGIRLSSTFINSLGLPCSSESSTTIAPFILAMNLGGLWTSEPDPKEYCTSGANVSSAWSQFATSTRTLSIGTVEVPLYLWQYAESGVCTYTYGIADFAGGQILDLDGSDSHGGETYMFEIES
jgi:hypothetical protein